MRKILLMFICCVVGITTAMAEEEPKVMCMPCGGTGRIMAGYMSMPCVMCQGKGWIVDPYYYGQKYMQRLKACYDGEKAICRGDYSEAVDYFKEAMDMGDAVAVTYLGNCLELGMGVVVDRDLAVDFYRYASKKGDQGANEALKRIKTSGFWSATSESRNWFRGMLQAYLNVREQVGMAEMMAKSGMSGYSSSSSYYQDQYERWEKVAKGAYDSLTTLGYREKRNGKDVEGGALGSWGGRFSSMKSEMRKAQREMRELRSEARRNGYTISRSNYENINVNY